MDGLDGNERLTQLDYWPEPYRLIQNIGRGLLMQGTREWKNYRVTARMTPHMCEAGGLGIRVQGMTRYYALLISQEGARLVRSHEGKDTILASATKAGIGHQYELTLQAKGINLQPGSIRKRFWKWKMLRATILKMSLIFRWAEPVAFVEVQPAGNL